MDDDKCELRIRFQKTHYEHIQKQAAATGVTPGQWIRTAALEKLLTKLKAIKDPNAPKKLNKATDLLDTAKVKHGAGVPLDSDEQRAFNKWSLKMLRELT